MGPRHDGEHVRLAFVGPGADGSDESRIYDQLSHAYRQFMPESDNVILLTTFWRDEGTEEDLTEALEEFWTNGKHPLSNIVVYLILLKNPSSFCGFCLSCITLSGRLLG